MAKEFKRPYWQVCGGCDGRYYSADPAYCQTCDTGSKVRPASEHPDNQTFKETPRPTKAVS
jgi:hypothetical protein